MSAAYDQEADYAEFHRAFGEFIREWAQFEAILVFILTELLHVDGFRARVVWASMPNFRSRHQLLARLGATFLDDACLPEFRTLLRRAKNLARNRNMTAHAHGGVHGRSRYVFLWDGDDEKLGVNFMREQFVQLQNVKDWSKAASKLAGDFLEFRRTRMQLFASTKMHRELQARPTPNIDPRNRSTPEEPQPPLRSFRASASYRMPLPSRWSEPL